MRCFVITLLFTSGCWDPQPLPQLPFEQTGATPTLHLDTLEADLRLPETNLPEGTSIPSRFELAPAPPRPAGRGRSAYVYPLPFPVTRGMHQFRPAGMDVSLEEEPLPFDMAPYAPDHANGWRIKDGDLHIVLHGHHTAPKSARIDYPSPKARLTRLDPALSARSPAEYATYTATQGRETRPGLLLPSPSSATWQLTLPRDANLEAWASILPLPLPLGSSDGALLTLSVTDGGDTREIAEVRIPPPPADDSPIPPTHLTADLSKYGGRTVSLTLSTRGGPSTDFDYVFVGSPVIHSDHLDAAPRRVVVIGIDTLRPDHLGFYGYPRDTSGPLDAFATRSTLFEHAWAPAPRTRPSFRSATTGRDALDAVGSTNVGEVLRERGFATAGFVANLHLNPRFGFHLGFDLWSLDPDARAEVQVDRALAWLDRHAHQDAFLFLHLMDPHIAYQAPEPFAHRFASRRDPLLERPFNRWNVVQWIQDRTLTEEQKTQLRGMYDGEIAYTSHQLERLLSHLDANTLVIVHSDHGEEFFEHGGFEHNHTLYDEVTRALILLHPPTGSPTPRRISEPVALWDIAPTIYDYLGIEDPPPTEGRSLKPLLETPDGPPWDRALPLGHLMYGQEKWGVVYRGHKYLITTATGEEELYDLSADPAEQVDLAETTELEPYRRALGVAHQMPAGPGWRVELRLQGEETLQWHLPAPAISATPIDPEAARSIRTNKVWGEVPPVRPEDVARVDLSSDGRLLTLTPGSHGIGMIRVRFEDWVPPGGEATRGDTPLPMYPAVDGRMWARTRDTMLRVRSEWVFEPRADEFARMGRVDDVDPSDLEMLESLGYVGAP